jgi:hypothetical protein
MAFDDAAINIIFDKIISYALATGRFDHVNQHEPKNSPGTGMLFSLWVQAIRPVRSSGLGATSGLVVFQGRIYTNFISQPYDMIDPNVMAATADLMNALSGDFDFGGEANVRAVDLLGQTGGQNTALSAQAGYVEIDRQMMRVMTIMIPIIVDDMFIQGA